MTKNNHNSKNKIRKNWKFDFSLDLADSRTFICIWLLSKLIFNFFILMYEETLAKYAVDIKLFRLGSTKFPYQKKIEFFFLQKCFNIGIQKKSKFFFIQKCSNLHERSGIGWIERKIKFPNFPISVFQIMVIFVLKNGQYSMNFHDSLKK